MFGITIKTRINDDGKVEVTIDDETVEKRLQRDKKGISTIDIINDYCVIDIETTGLDSKYDEIIEISALKVRNNKVIDQYTNLVKPKQRIFVDNDEKRKEYLGKKVITPRDIKEDYDAVIVANSHTQEILAQR